MNGSVDLFERAAHNPSFNAISASTTYRGTLVDLCVPVNPYFPPGALVNEIIDHLPQIMTHYPDYADVHEACVASLTGVPAANVVVGNGSTELITLLCEMSSGPMVTSIPTFGRWTDVPRQLGTRLSFIERRKAEEFRLDVDDVVAHVERAGARTLVVSNPNNPTGAWFEDDAIERLVRRLGHLESIIIDESFIGFSHLGSAERLAARSENVCVVKSMGKTLGAHGLRLGYAVTNAPRAARLRERLPYWNINGLASFVLRRLERYQDDYRASLRRVQEDRRYMLDQLADVDGLSAFPSQANFVYVELASHLSGNAVRDALLDRHGIVVRECGNKLGSTRQFLRLAVHSPPIVDRLTSAMRKEFSRSARARPA